MVLLAQVFYPCYIGGMKLYKTKLFPCAVVAVVAALVRIASYSSWLGSPFTEYHRISGLDMMTHMQFGLDFANGSTNFSLHKLLCWAMIRLTGQEYPVKALVLSQHCIAVLVPVFVVLISLRLSGRRSLAVFAGLFAALYAPLLMYESFALVESLFLVSSLVALHAVLSADRRRPFSLIICGALVLLPATVRFSGIFLSGVLSVWFLLRLMRRRESRRNIEFMRPAAIFAGGSLCTVLAVLASNYLNCGEPVFFPGRPVVSYVLEAGAQMKINPEDDLGVLTASGGGYEMERRTASYLSKLLDIIRPYEIPNNLNYYFIRNQIPAMKALVGPMFLIPLGLSGFLLALARPTRLARVSILFMYFAALSAPMVVFLPLARYRLALLPVFAYFAAFYVLSVGHWLRNSQQRPMPLLLSLLVYVVVLTWSTPSSFPLRSEDFVAIGEAMEHKGAGAAEIILAYTAGYNLAPDSQSAVAHLSNHLMNNGNFADARTLLEEYCAKFNDSKTKTMLASALLGVGEFSKAKELLLSLPEPKSGRTRANYHYQIAECHRLLGEMSEAMASFRRALDAAENEQQRDIVRKAMEKLPGE